MASPSDNLRGAALMTVSMAAFVANDSFLKALSDELPLFQAMFLRGIATTAMMAALAHALGAWTLRLPRREAGRVALRTLAEIAAAYLFLTALFNMPLANASAIIQAVPLTVTFAGALFLGEAVGWRRMSAILVGLVGVLLIVQPGSEGFTIYSVYALGAVAAVTLRDLVTRGIALETSSLMVATAGAAGVTLFSGLGALAGPWVAPSPLAWAQLAGSALTIIFGYTFAVSAMRVGDIASVTPFRYSGMIWALLAGLVVFGERPGVLTLTGAALVVATGLYTFDRERRLARRGVAAPAPVDTPRDSL